MASHSSTAVSAAIAGNTLVMVAKLLAYGATGSGAMLSEGIHSAADVLNQCLIMLGMWLGHRGPDADHPYGYQADRFIWSMISAVGIFFLGCGVTGYHGVMSLLHLKLPTPSIWAYVVLGFSLVVEGSVLMIALKGFFASSAGRPRLHYLLHEADPPQVAVLLEDSVAVAGIGFAFVAIGLSNLTGQAIWDALGTLLIALLLGLVAAVLIAQNRRLLIGTAVPAQVKEKVLRVLQQNPAVEAVFDFKSRMITVDRYRIKMEVEFDGRAIARRVEPLLRQAYPELARHRDFSAFCEAFAERLIDALGDEIDEIEAKIRLEVPHVEHVDIEAD